MKKNLILLHGALGSADQFNELKALLENDFNVISFNFEGHGGRATTNDYSIALFAENTLAVIAEHQLEKADIFGYSMGGYVALQLALNHPGKVGKIVTLGTKFDWTQETAARESKMLNPDKIEEKVPKFAAKLQATHQPLNWKNVVENTAKMMIGLGNGARLEPAALQQLQHPVLIGIGAEDNMVSIAESEQAANALPNGNSMIINGFHHPIEKVDKSILAKIITGFINTDK